MTINNPVISLFEIYLDGHESLLSSSVMDNMHCFLGQNRVIKCSPPWDECSLKRSYHDVQERTKMINKHLCDYLISHVAKAYREDLLQTHR